MCPRAVGSRPTGHSTSRQPGGSTVLAGKASGDRFASHNLPFSVIFHFSERHLATLHEAPL